MSQTDVDAAQHTRSISNVQAEADKEKGIAQTGPVK